MSMPKSLCGCQVGRTNKTQLSPRSDPSSLGKISINEPYKGEPHCCTGDTISVLPSPQKELLLFLYSKDFLKNPKFSFEDRDASTHADFSMPPIYITTSASAISYLN